MSSFNAPAISDVCPTAINSIQLHISMNRSGDDDSFSTSYKIIKLFKIDFYSWFF